MASFATNKKAYRNYELTETFECGIVLSGGEVKSIRAGHVNFADAFARIEKEEVLLYSVHINPYEQASHLNLPPDRVRKLLLHKKEILKLTSRIAEKRLVLVPTKIYSNKRGLIKVEIALGVGKKLFDKREDIKKRDLDREMRRSVKN